MRLWLSKRIERKVDIKFEKLIKAQQISNWSWYWRKREVKVLYWLAGIVWK